MDFPRLLTTGSVVRTRAGEKCESPSERMGFFLDLRRVRRVVSADRREEKGPWMAPAGRYPGPKARGRMPRAGGRTRAGELDSPSIRMGYYFIL
jgi:hypothetical protein